MAVPEANPSPGPARTATKGDPRRRHILRVTIGYGVLAALWILLSDSLMVRLLDPVAIQRLSTAKGLLFVIVTTLLLYYGLRATPDQAGVVPRTAAINPHAPSSRFKIWIYLFAVAATLATLQMRRDMGVSFGERPLLIMFMLPITLSAIAGGLGPGLTATLLAAIGILYVIVPPQNSFAFTSPYDLFHWSLLVTTGLLVSGLSEVLHRLRRQSEIDRQFLAVTLASIGDGVITTDNTGTTTYMNLEAERLTGWTRQEALRLPLAEVYRPITEQDGHPVADPIGNILAAREMVALDSHTLLRTRDGRSLPITTRGTPIRKADGTLLGAALVFRDDSQRHQAETVVRAERTLYQDLVDSQPAGIYRIRVNTSRNWQATSSQDVPYHFDTISPRFCEILGASRQELEENPALISQRIHSDDRESFIHTNEEANASLTPFNWEGRMLHNGRSQWVQFQSLPRQINADEILWTGLLTDISARKQSEMSLRESQAQFALLAGLLERSSQPFSQAFPDGRLGFVNQAYRELIGYSAPEITSLNWQKLTAPEWREKEQALIAQLHATGQPIRYEKEYIRKDGSRVPIELLVHLARDEEGEPLYYYSFLTDLSDRKKAEQDLRESEKTYHSLFDNMLNGVAHVRMIFADDSPIDLEYLAANPAFPVVTGLPTNLVGRRISEILPNYGRDNPESMEIFGRVATTGKAARWDHYLAAVDRWFSFSLYSPARGEVMIIIDNITERKKAELALRENEARLRAISDNLPDGYIYQSGPGPDGKSRFHYLSAGVNEIHGLTPEAVMADASLLYHQVDPAQTEALALAERESFANLTDFAFEVRVCRPDSSWRWLAIRSRPHRKQDGQVVWDGVATDITSRKLLEGQLFQAQKMEFIGRLAGGVAHDFNNMLTVIGGHAELALSQTPADDPRFLDLQEIQGAARRSANLTRQLLAFARKQTVSPKVLDLNDTLGAMLKMLQRLIGEDIDLAWLPGRDLWPVKIDPSQIDQLLANLAVNARDAIAGVGKVTIETANHQLDTEYCAVHPDVTPGDYVELAVSDSGCGIAGEVMSHLFEPFFTTKKEGEGTGLGLATVYGIVKQNRGTISVYSEPGKGTTFRIYLPRHNEPGEINPEITLPTPAPGGSETVLIVEDDPAILGLSKRFVERLGYRTLTATSPGEAIRQVEACRGTGIDLLLTDVVMPEMNGQQLAARLKELLPGLKCLFMSGYTADAIARQGVLDEGICFLAKPFSAQDMAVKLREALEQKN